MRFLNWEGARHRPGGVWAVLIQAGSVAAALWVLWIGALAQLTGNFALWLSKHVPLAFLPEFAAWARAVTPNRHPHNAQFNANTNPNAFGAFKRWLAWPSSW